MKKIILTIGLISLLFIFTSCYSMAKYSATVNIYNNSDYPVTEIYLPTMSNNIEEGYLDILEPGKNYSFLYIWPSQNTTYAGIYFSFKGNKYQSLGSAQMETNTSPWFNPHKFMKDGDTVNVIITNDGWSW